MKFFVRRYVNIHVCLCLQLVLSLLTVSRSWAASCCGGQAALPDLITGDERRRVSAAFQYGQVIGDAVADDIPVFRRTEDRAHITALTLSAGLALGERGQVAARTQFLAGRGAGDSDLLAGWVVRDRESLLDPWPKLMLLGTLTAPTGRSIYELRGSKDVVSGAGFWRPGGGVAAFTTWGPWDFTAVIRVSTGRARRFADDLLVQPGMQLDGVVGAGYALTSAWRVGWILQTVMEEPRRVTRGDGWGRSQSPGRLIWPQTLQISHFVDESSTLTLSYVDETWLGPVRSTQLVRSAVLLYGWRGW